MSFEESIREETSSTALEFGCYGLLVGLVLGALATLVAMGVFL